MTVQIRGTTWFLTSHLPRVWFANYGRVALARLGFSLRHRQRLAEETTPLAVSKGLKRESFIIIKNYLSPAQVSKLEEAIASSRARETLQERKQSVRDRAPYETLGDEGPVGDYFSVMQFRFDPDTRKRILNDIFPQLHPMMEKVHGRKLRSFGMSLQCNDANDPQFEAAGNRYIAHTCHIDSGPRFAKALYYLSDVDETCGPFEIIPNSRFSHFDELLRIAFLKKALGTRAGEVRNAIPKRLRRPTHLADITADDLDRRGVKVLGARNTLVLFDGMNIHCGSRNQQKPREILQFVFAT